MKAFAAIFLGIATLLSRPCSAQGVTQDTIVLGQAAVFTGPAAQLGIQMHNGIKAYLDHVNEKGGVHGRKLLLITEDDGYEADYNSSAMEGFLVAKVAVEGLRRAGKNLTRESFIDAMERMTDVDLGGFYVGYSPKNHAGSKFVDLTIITRESKFLR